LVVIAIIAILIGLLVPAVQKVRSAAARAQAQNNVKQIVLACHDYVGTYRVLPPQAAPLPNTGTAQPVSAHFHILPYLEQENLYNLGLKNGGAWPGGSASAASAILPVFLSPRDPSNPVMPYVENNGGTWGVSNFGMNHAVFGVPCGSNNNAMMRLTSIKDGTSNTVGFAEQYARCGNDPSNHANQAGSSMMPDNHHLWAYNPPWEWQMSPYFDTRLMSSGMAGTSQNPPTACTCIATSTAVPPQSSPTVANCNPYYVQAIDGTCTVGMMDGSVRNVSTGVDPVVWARALWPQDGFVVGEF